VIKPKDNVSILAWTLMIMEEALEVLVGVPK
jgi:hypothetical protein